MPLFVFFPFFHLLFRAGQICAEPECPRPKKISLTSEPLFTVRLGAASCPVVRGPKAKNERQPCHVHRPQANKPGAMSSFGTLFRVTTFGESHCAGIFRPHICDMLFAWSWPVPARRTRIQRTVQSKGVLCTVRQHELARSAAQRKAARLGRRGSLPNICSFLLVCSWPVSVRC